MPFWKLWGTKSKDLAVTPVRDENVDPQLVDNTSDVKTKHLNDPDEISSTFDQRHRSRNQMSVSRSGRYKQKQRKRVAIFDNPEFVDQQQQQAEQLKRKQTCQSTVETTSKQNEHSQISANEAQTRERNSNDVSHSNVDLDDRHDHQTTTSVIPNARPNTAIDCARDSRMSLYHNSNSAVQISAL